MKKVSMIFIGIIALLPYSKAQINLDYTFDSGMETYRFSYNFSQVHEHLDTSPVKKYITTDSRDNGICIYNLDYSVYKSFKIDLPNTSEITSYTLLSSVKLFNNDDLIEFVLPLYDSFSKEYALKLYNENGEMLKDFGRNYYWCYVFITENDDLKLAAYTPSVTGNAYAQQYSVYSLPNNISPSDIKTYKSFRSENLLPYPNPAAGNITLPYKLNYGEIAVMKIVDLNGNIKEERTINAAFDRIILDVRNYPKGIYIYEYQGISNKFTVK